MGARFVPAGKPAVLGEFPNRTAEPFGGTRRNGNWRIPGLVRGSARSWGMEGKSGAGALGRRLQDEQSTPVGRWDLTVASNKDFREWLTNKAEDLTPSEMKLARHMREHLEQWAFESATRLAERSGVHRSTIVRFAQRLGMAGFPELQEAARQALLTTISPMSELSLTAYDHGRPDLVARIYEREQLNLRETYRHLDATAMRKTAEGLARARNIAIVGRRFSYPIALYLSLALKTMRDNVRSAPDPGGSSIDSLFDLGPEDYALVVSLKRHSTEVQKTMRFLRAAETPPVPAHRCQPHGRGRGHPGHPGPHRQHQRARVLHRLDQRLPYPALHGPSSHSRKPEKAATSGIGLA